MKASRSDIDIAVLELPVMPYGVASPKHAESLPEGRRIPWVILALLGSTALGILATYQFLEHRPVSVSPVADRAPVSQTVSPVLPAVKDEPAATALLGTASSTADAPLDLIVASVSPGRNATEGTVSLGTDPRNPQVYLAGAILVNGARIEEIHSDHIVLSRGGRRARVNVATGEALTGQRASMAPGMASTQADFDRAALTAVDPQRPAPRPAAIPRADLGDALRAQVMFDERGTLTGFQAFPGTSPERLRTLGLEQGDVIQAIDGSPVRRPAEWESLAASLMEGRSVQVTVERKGQTLGLTLDGSVLQ